MKTSYKILLGGFGALTPILLNLVAVDLRQPLQDLTILVFLGYLIKVLILFLIGGIVAFLHQEEISPARLFELGIIAPALITALVNGNHYVNAEAHLKQVPRSISANIFVSEAHAETGKLKEFAIIESPAAQVWRGISGAQPNNVWFVVVGSRQDQKKAEMLADQFNKEKPGFHASVYDRYGGNEYYAVVIGANLTLEEAKKLKRKAIAEGFPKDTYLWTFPAP